MSIKGEIVEAGKKFGGEAARLIRGAPRVWYALGFVGLAAIGYDGLKDWLEPSVAELHQAAIDLSLLNELKEDGFNFDNETIRSQIFKSNGFDVTRLNGAEEHWEIKFNKDGTVNDVFKVSNHQFGTGPVLMQNDEYKVDDWRVMTSQYDRNLSEEDYAAAKAYYESHGSHVYKPGDPVSTSKLQTLLSGFKQHGINSYEIEQIIKKYGGLVDEKGAAFEIWMTDKGPALHQIPAGHGSDLPRLTVDGHWDGPDGKRITLK